jgi:hypothetical protein
MNQREEPITEVRTQTEYIADLAANKIVDGLLAEYTIERRQ